MYSSSSRPINISSSKCFSTLQHQQQTPVGAPDSTKQLMTDPGVTLIAFFQPSCFLPTKLRSYIDAVKVYCAMPLLRYGAGCSRICSACGLDLSNQPSTADASQYVL
jgi:hypothetical protein